MKRADINIGEMIRDKMDEYGYTYQQLAKLTGISKSALQRYTTTGGSAIPLNKMQIIAEVLRLDPVWWLSYEDAPAPPVAEDVIRLPILGEVAAAFADVTR